MRLWLLLLLSLPLAAEPAVYRDHRWEGCFRRSQGWNGADGAFSVPLGRGESGWLFSDTFVGAVDGRGRRDPQSRFLHNSWARIPNQAPERARFSCVPAFPEVGHDWYWVYQPRLEPSGVGYVLLGRFGNAPGEAGWNFAQKGTDLLRIDWSEEAPRVLQRWSLPHFRSSPHPLHFGSALLEHEGHLYVYGSLDQGVRKPLVVARASAALENFDAWRFWNGQSWTPQPEDCAAIVSEGANEFSVYPYKHEFRLLTQVGAEIRLHRSNHPQGPWSPAVVLFRTPESQRPGVLTYNAKAHPQLGWPLLITYNVNAFPPDLVMQEADLYRPRCLRLRHDPWLP
jgi:hypothetical protein